jgi:predicted HTH transcriptional regulator
MPRSVSELLHKPFGDLRLEDVAQIIEKVGDERETIFFEKKSQISPHSLGKACSSFANMMGGLLVVGVADEGNELVGIEPIAAEAQLWVKDSLRGNVIPLPPFRARWLELDGGPRGILLVLVEESSTTPHLW